MRPGLFALTGFPGVGKLTVARALADRIEATEDTALVVDNHWINNPIFGLVDQDGVTPLPPAVWDRVGEVAQAVVRTVEELTPPDWHAIFTAYLDGVSDTGWIPRLERVAAARKAVFVPVRLLCDPEENARRIVLPARRTLMKSVDAEELHRLAAAGQPYDPGHRNGLTLDITALAPHDAATSILSHMDGLPP